MKGERRRKGYSRRVIFRHFMEFLDSNEKVVVINYGGKELNSIYGIKDYAKNIKLPWKFLWRYVIKRYFQIVVFAILKPVNAREFKNRIYRFFGVKIGRQVYIAPGVHIDDTFPELITIGDGTIIGRDSSILTHEFTIKKVRFGRVNIGKNVIVGVSSIIRSGVSIGDGSVVAIDSFVNKDVPKMTEVGGIPAKKIKKLKKLI